MPMQRHVGNGSSRLLVLVTVGSTPSSERAITRVLRKMRALGPMQTAAAAAVIAHGACSAAVAQQQFVLDGEASGYALLLAPEAKPNLYITGVKDPGKQIAVLLNGQDRTRAVINVGIAGSATGQPEALVGRLDRYFLIANKNAPRLRFPIYIVTEPTTGGASCTIALSGKPQKTNWNFADVADFALVCDGHTRATYESSTRQKRDTDFLNGRLTSRWIRDPFGQETHALLLVTDGVKTFIKPGFDRRHLPANRNLPVEFVAGEFWLGGGLFVQGRKGTLVLEKH
jgi:hypothetical protein